MISSSKLGFNIKTTEKEVQIITLVAFMVVFITLASFMAKLEQIKFNVFVKCLDDDYFCPFFHFILHFTQIIKLKAYA